MVVHCAYGSKCHAARVDHGQPDQVGMIKFVIGQRGQFLSIDPQGYAFQRIGLVTPDSRAPRPPATGRVSRAVKLCAPSSVNSGA